MWRVGTEISILIEKMINYLRSIDSDEIVCFLDGYDVICIKDLTNLPNDFLNYIELFPKCKIIIGSDDNSIFPKFIFSINQPIKTFELKPTIE